MGKHERPTSLLSWKQKCFCRGMCNCLQTLKSLLHTRREQNYVLTKNGASDTGGRMNPKAFHDYVIGDQFLGRVPFTGSTNFETGHDVALSPFFYYLRTKVLFDRKFS